jgi:hypothetical protein
MKILHYSDKRVEELPELYSQGDVLFSTGDLHYDDFFNLKGKPMFGVYGNHCSGTYLPEVGITNVHLQVVEWNGLKIGGFQGSIRYKDGGGPQFTHEESIGLLENFPPVDIFLSHSPAFGLLDEPGDPVHEGLKGIRNYLDRVHPKYHFCGHIPPNAEQEYEGTKIWRTHGTRFIEIE